MPRATEAQARCTVFTFKEGLLSAIAHDLEIAVERFHLEWDDAHTRLEASFDPSSLKVRHAMKDGAPNPSALSDRDKRKIEATIRDEILDTARYPVITFTSTDLHVESENATLRGTLELHGRSRALEVRARRSSARWIAELALHQPDFGITPYSAMMGSLRIRPDIRVRLEI